MKQDNKMKQDNTKLCPYSRCHLNCRSKYHHRARFAHINENWRNKVKRIDSTIRQNHTDKINWEVLKKLGILYNLEQSDEKSQKSCEFHHSDQEVDRQDI